MVGSCYQPRPAGERKVVLPGSSASHQVSPGEKSDSGQEVALRDGVSLLGHRAKQKREENESEWEGSQ